MVGALARAALAFHASILLVVVVVVVILLESDSGSYLVNFVVNHRLDLSPAAMQLTTKFTK